MTGRVVFRSESGESCCVAVDPTLLSPNNASSALLVLDDLPPGPATVTIAGFTTDFAPAVPDVTDTCTTFPASAGSPCDPVRVAAPAFESSPLAVSIVAGAQTNLGEVDIAALPFVSSFSPAQDVSVPSPVGFDFTVVDAVTGIRADSVVLEVTFQRAEGEPPVFRAITKRVPLDLDECADGSEEPCSPEGDLDLVGFNATASFELPEGEVDAHISAENLAPTPRRFDLRYPFQVVGTSIPTPTSTPESAAPAADGTAGGAAAQAGGATGGAPPPPATPTATPEPGRASPERVG
jgi:hypothetical protein